MEENTPLWMRRLRLVLASVAAVVIAGVLFSPRPQTQRMPDRIPVRFWHMWTAEWEVVVNEIAEEFNKSQDVYEVIPLSVPNSADSKFLLAVTGGDPPDVMAQWNPVIPTWAESQLLTPFDDLMGPDLLKRFRREAYPAAQRIGMYKGKIYGITIGINAFAIYYRPSLFAEAGLDPERFPATLEELDRVAERLHKTDRKGELTRIGFIPSNFLHYAPIFGGGFYDWKTGEVKVNTPENLRALTYLADTRERMGYERAIRFSSGLDTQSFAGGWPFIGGSYAATVDGQWRVEQLRKYAPNLDYKTVPVPPPSSGAPLAGVTGGNFMIIPRGAKNPKGAWEFIKFWSGLENPNRAAAFYTKGGWLPLWPEVTNAPVYQEYIRKNPEYATFVKMLASPNLAPVPPVPYQVFLFDQILRAEDRAARGILTPQQALDNLERELTKELARRRELGYPS